MKLLMLIVDESRKEQLEVFLSQAEGVVGFTELPNAIGVGTTGLRLGSRAFPATSAVIFTVVAAEASQRLVTALQEHCRECGEKLKIFSWAVEEVM